MPLTRDQRNDAYRIFDLIREKAYPSNCTAERLSQRSGLPEETVLWALELLWAGGDGKGFIQTDQHRKSGDVGYFCDPKAKSKSPADLDALAAQQEAIWATPEDSGEDDDDDDDDEWQETEEDDDDGGW